MTTATHPQTPEGGVKRTGPKPVNRVQQDAIEGRYRPITTHQLTLAWWLYDNNAISKRQLRIYFAAHEMDERRFYTAADRKGCAEFTLEEIKALVGGRGSTTADRDLSADVKRLGALGLVKIARRSITFAETVEQVAVDDTDGFFRMWDQMDHRTRGRSVPVPRRTLRELAAGFTTGSSAYLIAALIRCVFWRRKERCYNTDGRIKDGWVAETFGVGLTAVRQGRRRLQELGLLEKRDGLAQWNLNRYGSHIVVHCDWSRSKDSSAGLQSHTQTTDSGTTPGAVDNLDTSSVGGGRSAAKSDTLPAQNSGRSDTPCLNRSALPTEDLETRRLGAPAPGPSGVSLKLREGSRKKRGRETGQPTPPTGEPTIRDIQPDDLEDTERLFKLHAQFVSSGLAKGGRAGELDFLALANRARVRGFNPGGLLRRLLEQNRTGWITIADEEAASRRMREHFAGPPVTATNPTAGARSIKDLFQPRRMPGTSRTEGRLSEESAFVEKCVRTAREAGLREAQWWLVAQRIKQWTRDQWGSAYARYQLEQVRHWHGHELEESYA